MTFRSAVAALIFSAMGAPMCADVTRTLVSYSDLHGWHLDDHAAALDTFLVTCRDLRDDAWRPVCNVAQQKPNPRLFFETFFQPIVIEDSEPGLFTGYFEPEILGSLTPTPRFNIPLYAMPPEVTEGAIWKSRKEIESTDVLKNRGLELAWVDDPVKKFFLQIQGSGRIRLPDGKLMRLGYGGSNGFPYSSIGKELIRRGELEAHNVSAGRISQWVKDNPLKARQLLWHNRSYVFFRNVDQVPPEKGPLGAMNRSLTPMRSIAVDPTIVRLGAPVWIEKSGQVPLNRLMIAQDTGSAINGAQRADIFYGTGPDAGRQAGAIKDPGRIVVLLPIELALAQAGETNGLIGD